MPGRGAMAEAGLRMVERTPSSGDNGVDVVALKPPFGDLIQCKTSTAEQLSWDAVKDVVTGEAFYKDPAPEHYFQKGLRIESGVQQHRANPCCEEFGRTDRPEETHGLAARVPGHHDRGRAVSVSQWESEAV